MASLPETDVHRIERYCDDQVPGELQDQVRWEAHVRGTKVTLCETRAPWDESGGPWSHLAVAQLRYRPESHDWTLHWADRNARWHPYAPDGVHVTGTCAELLAEVGRDPTHVFKG